MFKMGCAKCDVTPEFPVYLRGYATRNKLTDKVEEPLEAGVIALQKNDKRVLLITADSIGIKQNDCRRIYAALQEKFNINYPDIIISSSHTHFAPCFHGCTVAGPGGELPIGALPPDEKYFEFFMQKLIPTVEHALQDLEEVELLQAEIPVSCVAFNRRTVRKRDGLVDTNYFYPANDSDYNFSDYDKTMHVWKFMRGTHPKAVLARYGCHPVTGGYDSNAISADYPGYFKRYIQQELGCPGFFMLGTAGDVVPMRRNGTSRRDIGLILASAVKLHDWAFRKAEDFTLKTTCETFEVVTPRLLDVTADDVEAEYAKLLSEARQQSKIHSDFFLYSLVRGFYLENQGATAELQYQILQLGGKKLVILPFEVFTIVGQKIREAIPNAVVVSCSGGSECYLPLQEDFAKGGYETLTGTRLAQDTGDKLLAMVIEKLKTF